MIYYTFNVINQYNLTTYVTTSNAFLAFIRLQTICE